MYPKSLEEYEARCQRLLAASPIKFAVLDAEYDAAEDARCVVSDTLGGRQDRQGEDDLSRLRHPLGRVFGGRKTSPLRFRVLAVGDKFRIAAIWDGRTAVTGNTTADLQGVISLLADRKPRLGQQLRDSPLCQTTGT